MNGTGSVNSGVSWGTEDIATKSWCSKVPIQLNWQGSYEEESALGLITSRWGLVGDTLISGVHRRGQGGLLSNHTAQPHGFQRACKTVLRERENCSNFRAPVKGQPFAGSAPPFHNLLIP